MQFMLIHTDIKIWI